MVGIPFSGIAESFMLLALGIGFIVLYLAKREEKWLQLIGYGIGGIIIVLSLIYLIVGVVVGLTYNKNIMRYNKTMMQQPQPRMMQPRSAQPAK